MDDCIFCKIVNEEIPCNKIYEDKNIIAFLDIQPVNPGHTLVVSKEHFANLLETPDNILKELIIITKKLSKTIQEVTNAKGFNIHINNNKTAGQAIPHIHFHIIPRFERDGRTLWKGAKYKENEEKEIADKITSLLN